MKTSTNLSGTPFFILNYGKRKLPITDIKYIVGEGNYSNISITSGKGIMSSFTLRTFTEELNSHENFFSPRKGLLINLNFLKEIIQENGTLFVKMDDGKKHILSRRKGRSLIDYLKERNWKITGLFGIR